MTQREMVFKYGYLYDATVLFGNYSSSGIEFRISNGVLLRIWFDEKDTLLIDFGENTTKLVFGYDFPIVDEKALEGLEHKNCCKLVKQWHDDGNMMWRKVKDLTERFTKFDGHDDAHGVYGKLEFVNPDNENLKIYVQKIYATGHYVLSYERDGDLYRATNIGQTAMADGDFVGTDPSGAEFHVIEDIIHKTPCEGNTNALLWQIYDRVAVLGAEDKDMHDKRNLHLTDGNPAVYASVFQFMPRVALTQGKKTIRFDFSKYAWDCEEEYADEILEGVELNNFKNFSKMDKTIKLAVQSMIQGIVEIKEPTGIGPENTYYGYGFVSEFPRDEETGFQITLVKITVTGNMFLIASARDRGCVFYYDHRANVMLGSKGFDSVLPAVKSTYSNIVSKWFKEHPTDCVFPTLKPVAMKYFESMKITRVSDAMRELARFISYDSEDKAYKVKYVLDSLNPHFKYVKGTYGDDYREIETGLDEPSFDAYMSMESFAEEHGLDTVEKFVNKFCEAMIPYPELAGGICAVLNSIVE